MNNIVPQESAVISLERLKELEEIEKGDLKKRRGLKIQLEGLKKKTYRLKKTIEDLTSTERRHSFYIKEQRYGFDGYIYEILKTDKEAVRVVYDENEKLKDQIKTLEELKNRYKNETLFQFIKRKLKL